LVEVVGEAGIDILLPVHIDHPRRGKQGDREEGKWEGRKRGWQEKIRWPETEPQD